MTTVNPIESAKENYKAALLAQAEPINARIAELKTELASLETQKRTITARLSSGRRLKSNCSSVAANGKPAALRLRRIWFSWRVRSSSLKSSSRNAA